MPLTPEEKQLYSHLFKELDPETSGVITGDKARSTFEKSGLPPAILGKIWQIADPNSLGFLTQFGFCTAMRLIGYTQAGHQPSPGLAEHPGPLPKFAGLPAPSVPLQPQDTNSSFMQSHSSPAPPSAPSVVPSQNQSQTQIQAPITAHGTGTQAPLNPVSPADYEKFSQLFIRTVGSPQGELGGNAAKDIFLKARLPTSTLGVIWSLVDRGNVGSLKMPSFILAMHLIQALLSGSVQQLPQIIPDYVWASAQGPASSLQPHIGTRQSSHNSISSRLSVVHHRDSSIASEAPGAWVITPALGSQYGNIFNSLDKEKKGYLNPDEVASFLMTSKLDQKDLATVWDLADIQNTGIFSIVEFSVALYLVNKKIAGETLPNVVPESLLESAKLVQHSASDTSFRSVPATIPEQPSVSSPQRPKSNLDELAGLFHESSPVAGNSLTVKPSSSDLTYDTLKELPKVRNNLTGSFKPTSSFGMNLLSKQSVDSKPSPPVAADTQADLISHADVPSNPQPFQAPNRSASNILSASESPAPQPKSVNYDALRAVPPPPPQKKHTATASVSSPVSQTFAPSRSGSIRVQAPAPQQLPQTIPVPVSREPSYQRSVPENNDLLADPEVSGQLSRATADTANLSNQIKSLSNQTTILHDKKTRAETELAKILALKGEIETKLKSLKVSYDQEVSQLELVEQNLVQAKEEAEALRSEASIAEAKQNSLSAQLNEQQLQLEEMEKQNSTLKERLGVVNAEIVENEKLLTVREQEHQQFANNLNVKKSQVQVAVVQNEKYKSQLKDIEASHTQMQADFDKFEEERLRAEHEQEVLAQQRAELEKKKPTGPSSSITKKSLGLVGGVAAGIATGVAATTALMHSGDKESDKGSHQEKEQITQQFENKSAVSNDAQVLDAEREVEAQKEVVAEEESGSSKNDNSSKEAFATEEVPQEIEYEAGGESFSRDPTTDLDELDQKFPDLSVESKSALPKTTTATSTTLGSTVASTDFKSENETPITSPTNSEFQFPQGGMIGMPGVLLGIQRTESLTSSVQNNAAMSVRDDNIEVSDRETVGANDSGEYDREVGPQSSNNEESIDGDKMSSGVESFEIVNPEEPKEATGDFEGESSPRPHTAIDEEFPPIKELEYDDEDTSSEDDDLSDKFVNAVQDPTEHDLGATGPEDLPEELIPAKPTFDDFDAQFNDLDPATPDINTQKDAFDEFDEFAGLEEAHAETSNVDDFEPENSYAFNEGFTNEVNTTSASNVPDFSTPGNSAASAAANDEWEQLFAGFGNANTVSEPQNDVTPPPFPPSFEQAVGTKESAPGGSLTSNQDYALKELEGMGFELAVALLALEQENWNLESATNYLLDHA